MKARPTVSDVRSKLEQLNAWLHGPGGDIYTPEERRTRIEELRQEIHGLIDKYIEALL